MRYERKYRTEQLAYAEVVQMVRSHPMSFRTLHPDRQVNNVYFDTPELHFLHENLHGVAERRKYRIRWYGSETQLAASPTFEVKCKDGEIGEKFAVPMAAFRVGEGGQMQEAFNAGFRALHGTHALVTDLAGQDLVPVLLNTYLRSYFISYDGKYRLTLDRAMLHHGFNARQLPLPYPYEDRAVVMEIKYAAADDDGYQRVAQRIPLRLARNSKYTIGMIAVANG